MAESTPKLKQNPSNWNLPNLLTVVRVFFAPVVLVLVLVAGDPGIAFWPFGDSPTNVNLDLSAGLLLLRWLAVVFFVLAMLTDAVDGFLARRWNQITDFGKIADPIADKGMTLCALIALSIVGAVWWPATALILIREVGITVYRFVALRRGLVIPASRAGKLKTVVQTVTIALALSPLIYLYQSCYLINIVLIVLSVVLTLYSGIWYILDARGGAAAKAAAPDSDVNKDVSKGRA